MASVWQHPNSPYWTARYRGAEGKTVNKSTGVSDKAEAQRIAAVWEVDAAREREKALASHDEISPAGISAAIARAERLARQKRLDPNAARAIVNDILAAAGQAAFDATTSRAWWTSWVAGKNGNVKERTLLKYEQVSRDWLDFLGERSDLPLERIARADAIGFRDSLAKSGLSARTVNQIVKLTRAVHQEAVEQGMIGKNPFAGVKVKRESDEDTKRLPFTSAEVATLIRTAEGDWRGLIILAATTGLRLIDGARLKWGMLDLDHGLIRIKTGKTGVKLTLPIHPDLSAWISDQTRGIGTAPLFPTLATKGGAGKSGLSMAFRRIMDRAKIDPGVARQAREDGKGRTTSQKSFHSLRHFAATQLASAGVRSEIARAITGHADESSHAGYINADTDALRGAVAKISLSA